MWVLILYIYAGALSTSDSVSLTSVPGFTSEQACLVAGKKSNDLVSLSQKNNRFICVKQ